MKHAVFASGGEIKSARTNQKLHNAMSPLKGRTAYTTLSRAVTVAIKEAAPRTNQKFHMNASSTFVSVFESLQVAHAFADRIVSVFETADQIVVAHAACIVADILSFAGSIDKRFDAEFDNADSDFEDAADDITE